MGLATFKGGVHPYEGKELSEDKPIVLLAPQQGEEMVYPLSQHIGKPALPSVKAGDHVEKGALVAAAAEGLSVNIHTGMSGVVTEVTDKGIRICGEEE